ncbi:MAG: N-acetyltransferase [Methylomicrobium sp.]
MDFELYDSSRPHEVKKLFTDVFTDSAGREEGELIGNLALELQETTDPNDIFGFIAKDGNRIVGCLFFTRLIFEPPIEAFILAPVAIATDYQKQGLGQKLIAFGIEHLKSIHVELVFTYGDPHFYSKTGFKPITEDVVKAPLKLSYPEGWLAQSLIGDKIEPISGSSQCVDALNHPCYW